MAEGNNSKSKPRSVLGDVTNRMGTREIPQKQKTVDFKDKDGIKRIRVSPRFCTEISKVDENRNPNLGNFNSASGSSINVDNVVKASSKFHGESNGITVFDSEGMQEQNVHSVDEFQSVGNLDDINNTLVVNHDSTNVVIDDGCGEFHLSKGKTSIGVPEIEFSVGENVANDFLGSSGMSNKENVTDLGDLGRGDAIKCSDAINSTGEEKSTQSGINDQNADNLNLSQSSSFDPGSSSFGVDGGIESIRACSCSFCTKAASIWLDLHHQDIKGRVSAIRKSEKEAGLLAERSCRSNKDSAERIPGVKKMESHLMNRWRCLFQSMSDIWEEEGNRLEASLRMLAELRDKCRADLALINSKPSEEH